MEVALARPRHQKHPGKGVLISFIFGFLGAFFIFLPFLIVDKGFFIYTGDYNLQQIPFYMYVQQFIKTGGGTWSWATDIGTSVVNSYSFYNIGSPFLWITLLFPSRWMPYLMAPLFMLKFACIAASACLYLQRYAKSRNMAVVCSLIFAFCGFNTYNIFFNHMLDPVAIFPLMLWAMDGFMLEKKRGYFALTVGLALLNSYFFFIGNVVFLLLYFFVKVYWGEYKLTPKEFGLLAMEAVLGVGIGMALALPSLLNLLGNPRTDNFANGFNLVMYWNVQQYFNIFTSMILPPDPPWWPNLFTEGAIKHTSMSVFLPIVSISGVVAYIKGRKKSSIKTLLILCAVFALVPVLNSSFYAFNASYYARWYYMAAFIMVLATLRSLEDADLDLVFGARVALGITAAYTLFGLLPTLDDGVWKLGVQKDTGRFWLTCILAVLAVGVFYILALRGKDKIRFAPLLLAAVMAFSVVYTVVHLAIGRVQQWSNDEDYKAYTYDAAAEIELPEDGFYRIDAFGTYDNMGLWLNQSCLRTFNSVVTPSIMEFYPMVGVKRDVSSKPTAANYPLRGLLNVRYTLVPLDKIDVPLDELDVPREELGFSVYQYSLPYTQLPVEFAVENLQLGWAPDADGESYIGVSGQGALGWNFWDVQGGYAIFENENYVPLGFTYNEYIAMDDLQMCYEGDRSGLLMRGIGLSAEQVEQYGYLFDAEVGQLIYETDGISPSHYTYAPITYDSYVAACDARRMTASYATSADSSGFTCQINMPQENLVFFGVPYDEGFTATVNGVPTEVLKVSGGMMAVLAPAGDNTIVFRYKTPGFGAGLAISAVCLLGVAVYMLMSAKTARGKTVLAAGQQAAGKPQGAKGAADKTKALDTGERPKENAGDGDPPKNPNEDVAQEAVDAKDNVSLDGPQKE